MNKDLLYSIRDYIPYLVIAYNGKESEKEYICIYIYVSVCMFITESLYCIPEIMQIINQPFLK